MGVAPFRPGSLPKRDRWRRLSPQLVLERRCGLCAPLKWQMGDEVRLFQKIGGKCGFRSILGLLVRCESGPPLEREMGRGPSPLLELEGRS